MKHGVLAQDPVLYPSALKTASLVSEDCIACLAVNLPVTVSCLSPPPSPQFLNVSQFQSSLTQRQKHQ